MTHTLKTWPEYFDMMVKGEKTFDLRKDDRPFDVGDTLVLQEYDPDTKKYSGRESHFRVTYILRNLPKFGLKNGFCILSVKEKEANF